MRAQRIYRQDEMQLGQMYVGIEPTTGEVIPVIISTAGPILIDQMIRLDTGTWLSEVGCSSILDWYPITDEFTVALQQVVERYPI